MEMKMRPVHPGEIIKHDYLEPLNLTIGALASSLGMTRPMLSAIINGRSSVSSEMAIRLSKAFDTTPDLWLGMQRDYDLYIALQNFNPKNAVKQVYPSRIVS